jgi:hypothetical protein
MKTFAFITLAVAILAVPARSLAIQNDADIVGAWDFTTNSPEGERTSTMVVSKDGDKLKAVAKGPAGERPYDSIELKGNAITVVLTISYNGSPMIITYVGKVDGAKMAGDADFGGLAQGTWSAAKK